MEPDSLAEKRERSWSAVIPCLRPGSRTVLFRPDSLELVMSFARRGFRLFLVHNNREFLANCKSALRSQGLASQLMGLYVQKSPKDLSLAKDFYEVVCCFESPAELLETILPGLAPRGLLVGPSEFVGADVLLDCGFGEYSCNLPDGFAAYLTETL